MKKLLQIICLNYTLSSMLPDNPQFVCFFLLFVVICFVTFFLTTINHFRQEFFWFVRFCYIIFTIYFSTNYKLLLICFICSFSIVKGLFSTLLKYFLQLLVLPKSTPAWISEQFPQNNQQFIYSGWLSQFCHFNIDHTFSSGPRSVQISFKFVSFNCWNILQFQCFSCITAGFLAQTQI